MQMPFKIDGILERIGFARENNIGIALSGGGAKGFSHIGVLKALSEFDMRPNIVSGVSAGSIAAVLYASGLSTEDIISCFADGKKFQDFTEWAIPKEGFMKLKRFSRLLESWLPVKRLEELNIPTVVCATDFDHGKSIGWSKGEIVPRVIASCSIPIVFTPVTINGVHYVDGGVLRNLPAWAIREYCTTLIASNCSPLNRGYSYRDSLLDIAMRSYHLMSKANMLQDIRLCDIVISPPALSAVGTFDLSSLRKAVTLGYDTACRVLEAHLKR
ncbi:MAG: patatin-like phospholipase family protein [Bacteroidales bacterium]|nr:patatin-like phospholipase family protein [Bacteroidales bacterium]